MARQDKARELAKGLYLLRGMELFLSLVFIAYLLFSGITPYLRDLLGYSSWLTAAIMGVLFLLAYSLVSLPLDYYQSKVIPQRFGLSHPGQTGLWAADKIKSIFLLLALTFLMVAVLYLLLGLGSYWWLLAALSFSFLSFILTLLLPDIFMRLFYRLEPVKDQDLKQRLMSMSEKAGCRALGVYSLNFSRRGTTANAMLVGQGVTKKILVSDTLIRDYPPGEIEVVLAHELGHHRLHHTGKMLAVSFLSSLAGFYIVDLVFRSSSLLRFFNIQGLSDPAGLPMLLAVYSIFLLVTIPFSLAYSRYMEKRADVFSLEITGKAGAFIGSQNRLTNQNLLKARPNWLEEVLFLDHPPHYKRVKVAIEYQEARFKSQNNNSQMKNEN